MAVMEPVRVMAAREHCRVSVADRRFACQRVPRSVRLAEASAFAHEFLCELRRDLSRERVGAEEAGMAYKDISEVVETMDKAGISLKVAALRPISNIKG